MAHDWTYSLGASQWQDLTQYESSRMNLASCTIAATRLDLDAITTRNTASHWIASDFGAGYFKSFVHDFEFNASNYADSTGINFPWVLTNTLYDMSDMYSAADGKALSIILYDNSGTFRVYIREYEGGSQVNQDFCSSLSWNQDYWVRMRGNENVGASGEYSITVWSTASRDTVAYNKTLRLQSVVLSDGLRYMMPFNIYADGTEPLAVIGGYQRNYTFRKVPGTEPEDKTFKELRTNINTSRATAGLGAYSWTASITDGVNLLASDILELRTALDDAYDEITNCAAHYTSDDSTHYTTDNSSHDSADNGAHYTTDDSSDNTTHDGTHYTTNDSTDKVTHYATHYSTHYGAYNSSRKTNYTVGKYASGLCMFKTYDEKAEIAYVRYEQRSDK